MLKILALYGALFVGTANAATCKSTFESIGCSFPGVAEGVDAHLDAGGVQSLPLFFDRIVGEYRGSLLFLDPGTDYDVTLVVDGVDIETASAKTWADADFACGSTVEVPTGLQTVVLKIDGVHGAPAAYVCYVPAPGGDTLDGSNVLNNILFKDSTFIKISGFKLINAQKDAIVLTGSSPVNDLVIEDNEITNWGRINAVSGFAEADDAIWTGNGHGTNYGRLVIQRNRIYDPRGGSNSWAEIRLDTCDATDTRCHPRGANAVFFKQSSGNNVIRYNDITAVEGRYFTDGISGASEDTELGFPGADSDIYGNFIDGIWDNAIEPEGGGRNVRVWGNLMDNAGIAAIATAPVRLGPLYLVQNIVLRTRRSVAQGYGVNTNAFKTDSSQSGAVGGRQYVLHNTIHGGVKHGVAGNGKCLVGLYFRNNIVPASDKAFDSNNNCVGLSNDLDFDVYTGTTSGDNVSVGPNSVVGTATYIDVAISSHLDPASLGYGSAEVLANLGLADVGAEQTGAPPMVFGIAAAAPQEPPHSHPPQPHTHPHTHPMPPFVCGLTRDGVELTNWRCN